MASITSNTNNTYYAILNVTETNYNISENYSDLYYEGILYSGYKSFSGYTIGYRVKINNEEVAYHDNTGNQTSMSANSSKVIITGTKRVYHNSDGTKKGMSISFEIWTNNYSYLPVSLSASGTMNLTDIPRQANITRCDNFNSDWNPYMEFNNPGGFTCNLRLEFAGNRIERNGYSGYGGGYTFELSESERQLLYSACSSSNSLTVRYVVATLINGVETWWSIADRTMTVVNSNPTFSNCTYKDVGDDSTKLTGDNQILINGFNDLQITISTANKAVAKNGATMSKYRLVCGSKSVEASYSSSEDISLVLNNVTDMTFIVYAIDSRGNSTNVTKSVTTWKNYSPIVIKTGSAVRTGGVGTETTLTFEGMLWNDSFGVESNGIVTCQYKHKKSNESEYSNLIDINPTISGNTFSFSSTIKGDIGAEGFNVSNSFNIQVIVTDKIKTATYDILLGSGTPAMAIHRNGVAFGKPYDENEGGSCQVDGKNINKKNITTGQELVTNEWLDEKQIYRKRIETGQLPNTENKAISSGLNMNEISVIKLEGIAKADNNTTIPLPFTTLTLEGSIALSLQANGNIHIQTGSNRSVYTKSYVDIYYIKNSL